MSESDSTSAGPGTEEPSSESALGSLYDAYGAELFRYASILLADPHSAEDAVQQVFLKLARKRTIRINSLERYLRQAVRNECYHIVRSRRRTREETGGNQIALLESPSPTELAEKEDERPKLERALRALPPEQREVVHLKIYEKRSFQEIAGMTRVPINTASSRYRYAMEKLKSLLTGEGEIKE